MTEVLPEKIAITVRQKKETQWMSKLRTALPYGLNNKIEEEHQRDSDIPIGMGFPSFQKIKNIQQSDNEILSVNRMQHDKYFSPKIMWKIRMED